MRTLFFIPFSLSFAIFCVHLLIIIIIIVVIVVSGFHLPPPHFLDFAFKLMRFPSKEGV